MIPPRTKTSAVEAILGGLNDNSNWDGLTDLTPFIASASAVVDRVNTAAQNKAIMPVTLSAVELELIERWLAAHFYTVMDPLYRSKSTMGASGNFQRGQANDGFETTDYGRQACMLDYSGMLRAIGKRQVAGGYWAGIEYGCGTGDINPNGYSTLFGG